jgi:hypothetical protein
MVAAPEQRAHDIALSWLPRRKVNPQAHQNPAVLSLRARVVSSAPRNIAARQSSSICRSHAASRASYVRLASESIC